VIVLGGFWT